ncbi:MAG: NAD-dependent succinate-semialdehyde dehydrogenase [Bacteroidetes bacterium]|nr:NAD-dependent succinate-semialdehyde dehydrogenase [Bacteroidota bacterium]
MQVFKSIFPYTQEIMAEYPLMSKQQIELAKINAVNAFKQWKEKTFSERAFILNNAAKILLENKAEYASLITHEMGKVLPEAVAEVEKCALVCNYYADYAESFLGNENVDGAQSKSFIEYDPIGAVFGIMPWNYPFWQVFRFAAPTLMAGNVVLLKHAPTVMGCAIAIENIFEKAGSHKGVFQSLIIDTDEVENVLRADIVQAVTLTGSNKAGSSFASLAGKYIKKSVLELGGSDACIILKDASLQDAAKVAVQSRMQNAGQSCIAAKRFIVEKNVHDEFVQEILTLISSINQGNPLLPNIQMGPMARIDLAEKLEQQMKLSIQQGAHLITGGQRINCNFTPGILLNVQREMPAFSEEIFGPLASIITVKDADEAITVANQSRYGLGASIWTKDLELGKLYAKRIQSGSVFINSLVKSDPALPFGGIKESGYGRELGKWGIHEFVNTKTIVINHS